jgi:hypothetical protein
VYEVPAGNIITDASLRPAVPPITFGGTAVSSLKLWNFPMPDAHDHYVYDDQDALSPHR